MKSLKLTFAVLVLFVVSAPAFANCGFCYEAAPGFEQCDGTPGVPCRVVVQGGQYLCFDDQGRCFSAAPDATADQWTVASVETNGLITASEARPMQASVTGDPTLVQLAATR
ncbi:MAG: hypothetical protein JWN02_294 [Acidobacteria bacterium]|jgi:hypothetical protein|nr:hypothetical protein [Acidobacteriota bacterium]